MSQTVDPWLLDRLVCPRDRGALSQTGDRLACQAGHSYPVVDGLPVMVLDDVRQTFGAAAGSLRLAAAHAAPPAGVELYLDSIEISEAEKQGVIALAARQPTIDPVVAYLVAATNGLMYRHLVGKLEAYPIPVLDLPKGQGQPLLDIGCSWGRWTIAAARLGYDAVGIDPSLGAVMAARRVARSMNLRAHFVVGDARYLPFADGAFATAFSYSVLQHFSREDAGRAVGEAGRVLAPGGRARVQMPTRYGIRCLYHQARRGFGDGTGFEVRYWSVPALRRMFSDRIGSATVTVDGYFGIGLQPSDAPLMTPGRRGVLRASRWLKRVQAHVPALIHVADSVYIEATKQP